MISNLFITLQWYLMLLVLGLAFYPLTKRLFPRFLDSGYAFSKILALLVLPYLMLVVGTLHILPFNPLSLIFLLILSAGGGLVVLRFFSLPSVRGSLSLSIIEEIL